MPHHLARIMPSIARYKTVAFDRDYLHTIDGTSATSSDTLPVLNPATKQALASVPLADPEQLDLCIAAAARSFPAWAATPLAKRQAAVHALGEALEQFQDDFVTLLVREQGKPRALAQWEVGGSVAWLKGIAAQSLPDEVVDREDAEFVTTYEPLGVCVGIVPWNYPMILLAWKIAPALVSGNCLIIKPSPFTPLCNLKFVELAQQILPPGVLSALSGDAQLGPWMTAHPGIAKISFTGSTATGAKIIGSAARGIKRVTLELGGNDAGIVCPDVDVQDVALKLFRLMMANSGQLCAATKRVYVHEDVYDEMRDALVTLAKAQKIGDGLEEGTDMGPVQNALQYERVIGFFEDCKKNGYNILCGGEVDPHAKGYFLPVTLIDNPPEDARIVVEEQFGPIVPLLKWSDEADVIRRANNTDYGLSGSVWVTDIARGQRIARQLEAGTVWINDGMNLDTRVAFGGWKMSGLGVENAHAGLAAWTNRRVVVTPKGVKVNGA